MRTKKKKKKKEEIQMVAKVKPMCSRRVSQAAREGYTIPVSYGMYI